MLKKTADGDPSSAPSADIVDSLVNLLRRASLLHVFRGLLDAFPNPVQFFLAHLHGDAHDQRAAQNILGVRNVLPLVLHLAFISRIG